MEKGRDGAKDAVHTLGLFKSTILCCAGNASEKLQQA
jgi:hypothetical protein